MDKKKQPGTRRVEYATYHLANRVRRNAYSAAYNPDYYADHKELFRVQRAAAKERHNGPR